MKKCIGLCMILMSVFFCSLTAHADAIVGPPVLQSEIVKALGLVPIILVVVVVTAIIIVKIKKRK